LIDFLLTDYSGYRRKKWFSVIIIGYYNFSNTHVHRTMVDVPGKLLYDGKTKKILQPKK
jgi:hypothetical protein